jgi:hypothetical protein
VEKAAEAEAGAEPENTPHRRLQRPTRPRLLHREYRLARGRRLTGWRRCTRRRSRLHHPPYPHHPWPWHSRRSLLRRGASSHVRYTPLHPTAMQKLRIVTLRVWRSADRKRAEIKGHQHHDVFWDPETRVVYFLPQLSSHMSGRAAVRRGGCAEMMRRDSTVGMQGGVTHQPDEAYVGSGWEWPTPEHGTPRVALLPSARLHCRHSGSIG